MPKNVIIIGGGVAGLSAACRLAERGFKATLLEAGSQLGGRARSVGVEFNGQALQIDNGQHILLGAYHETLKLLEKIGIRQAQALMRLPLTLETRALSGKTAFKLSMPRFLPFPLNQLFGFLNCEGLTFGEQISVVKFMLNLKLNSYKLSIDAPLGQFLSQKNQSQNVIKLLWEPLCLAALNTPLHLASTQVFLNVLKDAFSDKKSNSDLLLPKVDLSQMLAQPMARYVQSKQGEVIINQRVKSIKQTENGYLVESKKGTFEASHVIIATSPVRLRNVLADLPKLSFIAKATEDYTYQPIFTVYLQYAREITLGKPMLGLVGGLSQWVFDRGILCDQKGLMAVIISAEGAHQKLDHETLALMIAQELKEVFPALKKPLWHQVIAEKRATFTCKPKLARPANSTLYPNLYLAGDYTYADYPATIEGAVRSGLACADLVSNS